MNRRLYDKLAEAADQNGQTMHAEIIRRLNDSVEMDAYQPQENIHTDEDFIDTSNPKEAIRVLASLAKQMGVKITISSEVAPPDDPEGAN